MNFREQLDANLTAVEINRVYRRNRDAVIRDSRNAQIARRFNNPARQLQFKALQASKGGK